MVFKERRAVTGPNRSIMWLRVQLRRLWPRGVLFDTILLPPLFRSAIKGSALSPKLRDFKHLRCGSVGVQQKQNRGPHLVVKFFNVRTAFSVEIDVKAALQMKGGPLQLLQCT